MVTQVKRELRRSLKTIHLWGIAVGLVISGEYFGWSYGWSSAGTLGFLVTSLVIAAMYTTFIFSFTELTTAIPHAGGPFAYARRAFGPKGGYLAGIATLVARYTTQFRAMLGEHVAMNDPLALSRIETLTRGMVARGMDQWSARQAALRLLDRQLFGQASVIAYSRIYMLAAGLILLLIPLLLLVRQTKRAGGEQVVME